MKAIFLFLLTALSLTVHASPITADFIVADDGTGDFKTVQEAIHAVPDFRKKTTTIFIKKGVYKEKLILAASKQNVRFVGESLKETILTYDDYAQKKNIFGEEKGTSGSSSIYIYGEGFSAENITFQNSSGPVGQAVAVWAGRKRGVPTENVIIRNNVVYHAHGGFVIGSEMSGGAKNIWVYDCSFVGTDIGLRFKTTRGRGGVVENIYINNINMIDIPGEAILFDMYYAAVDPVPLAGEKRAPIKAVTVPVTEATPQFRNFYIKDVVANGAEKAIFFRGLPEMNIKNIHLENVTIQAKKGIEIIEASGIFLKNVNVIAANTNPVVHVQNGTNINIDGLKYKDGSALLFNLTGEKTKGIKISATDVSKAKRSSNISAEVSKGTLEISK
jgi:hypothetical protein